MAVLEERMNNFTEQNTKDHERIFEQVLMVKTSVEQWIEDADRKYASKLTEKIVYGMIGVILTSLLVALLTLVFKVQL